MRPDSRGFVTISTAGQRLAVSRWTVYRLRDRGLLDFVYLGDDLPRIRERDLDALIEHGADWRAA